MSETPEPYYPIVLGESAEEGLQRAIAIHSNQPAKELSHWELDWLFEYAPDIAAARWQECVTIAKEEIEKGAMVAEAVLVTGELVMERARFLVLRNSLAEEWQPRGGIEWALIDQLSAAQFEFLNWTHVLRLRSTSSEASSRFNLEDRQSQLSERDQRRCRWVSPRITESEAIREAMEMVERWNRMYLRILRQMRDLRRYVPPVIVNNGGQVNIAEKQVNIATGELP